MFGETYLWQFINQQIRKEQAELIYRIYITDTLRCISENTARLSNGKYFDKRYQDIIQTTGNKPERSAEDIINSVKNNINQYREEE